MEFSEKVKQARKELKLSQDAFARELGVAFSTINRWENERIKPSYGALMKFEELCKKHNLKID